MGVGGGGGGVGGGRQHYFDSVFVDHGGNTTLIRCLSIMTVTPRFKDHGRSSYSSVPMQSDSGCGKWTFTVTINCTRQVSSTAYCSPRCLNQSFRETSERRGGAHNYGFPPPECVGSIFELR